LHAAHHTCCALEYAVNRSVCWDLWLGGRCAFSPAPGCSPNAWNYASFTQGLAARLVDTCLHELPRLLRPFAFSGPTPSSSSSPVAAWPAAQPLVQHLPRCGLYRGGLDRSRSSCALERERRERDCSWQNTTYPVRELQLAHTCGSTSGSARPSTVLNDGSAHAPPTPDTGYDTTHWFESEDSEYQALSPLSLSLSVRYTA